MDPFTTPLRSNEAPESSASGLVTATIVEHLKQTRPWLILFTVLGFLWVGLGILGGLGMLAGGFFMASTVNAGPMGALFPMMGAAYLLFAAGAFFPTWFLLKQSSAINTLERGGGVAALEDAVGAQRRFWFSSGLLAISGVILYAVFMVVVMTQAASFTPPDPVEPVEMEPVE